MFSLIGNVLKYSILVVTVLVFSHIVQIRGVTISRHVENGMRWLGAVSPAREVVRVTQQFSSSVRDADDITPSDERELHHIILRSQKK